MADNLSRSLKRLAVSDLRAIAEKSGIDVSSCKSKKDYVQTMSQSDLTEERLKELLEATRN